VRKKVGSDSARERVSEIVKVDKARGEFLQRKKLNHSLEILFHPVPKSGKALQPDDLA